MDDTTLLLLDEIAGDNEMSIAAIRVRAQELLKSLGKSEENFEATLSKLRKETNMDEACVELLDRYRARKREILLEIV